MGLGMFLKKIHRLYGKLAFRLTVWYSGIFTLSILVALLAFYMLVTSIVHQREDADLVKDVKEYAALLTNEGIDQVKAEMTREALSDGIERTFLRLLSPDGQELVATDMSSWGQIGLGMETLPRLHPGRYELKALVLPGQDHPVRVVSGFIGPDLIMQIGESLDEHAEFLDVFQDILAPIVAISVLIASFAGWFIARRALSGVEEVTHIARQISNGSFGSRVPVKSRGDEIERLAITFNDMLDRIDILIQDIRDMGDNIAHDLRSPLARVRSAAEMVLTTTSASMDDMKEFGAGIIEECDRLLGMINMMLDIAEAESGVASPEMTEIDLVHLLRSACELFEPVAETHSIRISLALSDRCVIYGTLRGLQRLVANLLDNALKYTPPGGVVTVSVTDDTEWISLVVRDTGIGISDKDLPHIFKRFYRCDKSRGHHGSGLGLSLVQAITRSHRGTVRVMSTLGKGSTFTVTLPRSLS